VYHKLFIRKRIGVTLLGWLIAQQGKKIADRRPMRQKKTANQEE